MSWQRKVEPQSLRLRWKNLFLNGFSFGATWCSSKTLFGGLARIRNHDLLLDWRSSNCARESLNLVVTAVVGQHSPVKDSHLRQTADVNLYYVTKFSPYFPFALYCLYTKISSFMPVLTIGIVRVCFYLLISYSEKFSTWDWRLPSAVKVNLNLSTVTLWRHRFCNFARSEILAENSFMVRCHVTSK